jgi:hypothetical protein
MNWPLADPHAVADRSEDLAGAIELQELAVLSARHPRLAVRVEIQGAHEISHLHRPEKPAVAQSRLRAEVHHDEHSP